MNIQENFHAKFFATVKPLQIVGAHDGLGAKLIEKFCFDGVWASGLEISASHGVPDANILTMTECLERAQEMILTSSLPVIADVDTGFGDVNIVQRMIRLYEAAGVSAVVIEDKTFPKRNSFLSGNQELASIPEFCAKLRAARRVRKNDKGMLIIARIEALIAGKDLQEALERAHAYKDAGANGILIHSKSKEPTEIVQFLRKWGNQLPVVLVPTTYPSLQYGQMAQLGVKMIIYANQCMRASITAMSNILEIMKRESSTTNVEQLIAPVSKIFELQGTDLLLDQEKIYHNDKEEYSRKG